MATLFDAIDESVAASLEDDEVSPWELSGLYEGDIMLYGVDDNREIKNGLVDDTAYWPNGTIPYTIDEDDFSKFVT